MHAMLTIQSTLTSLARQGHGWASIVAHSLASQSQCIVPDTYYLQSRGAATVTDPSHTVKVVLLQNVPGLGRKGEVKRANPGWVRHKLFPSGAAMYATPENVSKYSMSEEERAKLESPEVLARKALLRMLRKLHSQTVTVSRRGQATTQPATSSGDAQGQASSSTASGADGGAAAQNMIGTVTKFDIAKAVAGQLSIELHDSSILMEQPITAFGTFKVPLNLRTKEDEQVELTVAVTHVKRIRHGASSV